MISDIKSPIVVNSSWKNEEVRSSQQKFLLSSIESNSSSDKLNPPCSPERPGRVSRVEFPRQKTAVLFNLNWKHEKLRHANLCVSHFLPSSFFISRSAYKWIEKVKDCRIFDYSYYCNNCERTLRAVVSRMRVSIRRRKHVTKFRAAGVTGSVILDKTRLCPCNRTVHVHTLQPLAGIPLGPYSAVSFLMPDTM